MITIKILNATTIIISGGKQPSLWTKQSNISFNHIFIQTISYVGWVSKKWYQLDTYTLVVFVALENLLPKCLVSKHG